MRVRSAQLNPVGKMALKRDLIPLTNLSWIQMVNHRQGIELIEAGSYVSIFDIRQAAQVNNEIGAPALAGQFITRSLHISIGQAETFAGSAQPRARLHFRCGKFSGMAQTPNCHDARYLSVTFPEQGPVRQQVHGGAREQNSCAAYDFAKRQGDCRKSPSLESGPRAAGTSIENAESKVAHVRF